jgi:actin-related protein 6
VVSNPVGGCAALPGFAARLEADLRPLVPSDEALVVTAPEDPATCAWRGGSVVGAGADFARWGCTS